ncbi:MAG TPA: FlgO family outer membrane protein [Blastocatellia bacterium]|nr:FlgO family outer membrane protein [Blastocatellia bacterium]
MIGETISHYRILERLGVGGMGEVYKAEDTKLHRHVALKLLLDQDDRTDEQREQMRARFLREAQAASALNHPNIATIYEIDEIVREGARYNFIVMEYVPGHTLKQASQNLLLPEVLEVILQVADALAEAHDRGIVHRDIKPSNVIVSEHHRAKLLDFGVAKYTRMPLFNEEADTSSLLQTEVLKTQPGMVLGTFAYMSPEQALGKEVDGRSDMFSLGVMFYELLAGRLPFIGPSMPATIDAILHADPLAISQFNAQVSADLERVVHWMLEKDPSRRYRTMRMMMDDLRAVKDGLPLPTYSYETNVGFATQSLEAEVQGMRTGGHRTGKSIAVMSFLNVTQNPADEWLGGGIAETVTADLKKIEGLSVIGRERVYESLRRMGVNADTEFDTTMATSVGREVGARWILTGGYQKISEMLRITARVVEVNTGEVLRTVKIDGQMKDIFELQDKIVYELSQDLDLSLKSGEREHIELKDTEVLEAYEAYSRAEAKLMTGNREALEEAITLLKQAITLDPNYARAVAGLGYAYTLKAQFSNHPKLFDDAVELFQHAIEMQPMMADGYSGIGMAFLAMGREDEAMGALRRALAFAPQDARVHSGLGRALAIGKGKFREALAEFEQATALNPMAGWAAQQIALCCAYLGEYERGEEAAREAIRAQKEATSGQEGVQLVGCYSRLAHLHLLQGRYEDAIAECYQEIVYLRTSPHALKERAMIEVNQKLVSAYVRQGNLEDARLAYDQLVRGFEDRLAAGADDPFTRYYVACAAAMMGEKDKALEHLRIAIEGRRNFNTARALVEIDFENLRDDERFKLLVKPPELPDGYCNC